MWMMELAMNTITEETNRGSQRLSSPVMVPS
jgi:hypothetical protein